MNITKKHNTGFVLLFALLISSILLATGLGISRLMVRQISLASLSRESQVAFFAADSGMECAVHWRIFGKFNPVVPPATADSRSIYCNGYVIKDTLPTKDGLLLGTNTSCNAYGEPPEKNIINGSSMSCFIFPISVDPNATIDGLRRGACAFVVVDESDPTGLTTKITSNGYNKCDLSLPDALQRTLELTLVN
ncbi:MAG: hypothetical protein HY226_00110 [Candidatus Vogelbacteria bacterium]|nr:hypothetical protein [Candidatus Vogelbacteria bacterium]